MVNAESLSAAALLVEVWCRAVVIARIVASLEVAHVGQWRGATDIDMDRGYLRAGLHLLNWHELLLHLLLLHLLLLHLLLLHLLLLHERLPHLLLWHVHWLALHRLTLHLLRIDVIFLDSVELLLHALRQWLLGFHIQRSILIQL